MINQYDVLGYLHRLNSIGLLKITVNDEEINSFKVNILEEEIHFKIGVDYDDEIPDCSKEQELKNMKSLLKKCESFISELEKK